MTDQETPAIEYTEIPDDPEAECVCLDWARYRGLGTFARTDTDERVFVQRNALSGVTWPAPGMLFRCKLRALPPEKLHAYVATFAQRIP